MDGLSIYVRSRRLGGGSRQSVSAEALGDARWIRGRFAMRSHSLLEIMTRRAVIRVVHKQSDPGR
jgi:hypothetical protein